MDVSIQSSYAALRDAFSDLLGHPVQTFKKEIPTFLSIAGFPNYENVLSNVYQYFLNDRESGIGKLFFLALIDCLKDGNQIPMDSWIVKREVTTPKGNRIDLAIIEDSSQPENVIIIENKIFHHLANDLADYVDTYRDVRNTTLIVLSLQPMTGVAPPYINITHQQWTRAIKQRIGNSLNDIDLRSLAFVRDFLLHIDSYYENPINMDSYKFLFDNAEKIEALNALQAKALEQIKMDLQRNIPDEWEAYRDTGNSVSFKRSDCAMYLYVTTDALFKGKTSSYQIQLWIKGHDIVSKWKSTATQMSPVDGISIQKNEGTKEWTLIGTKKYALTFEELQGIGPTVSSQLGPTGKR